VEFREFQVDLFFEGLRKQVFFAEGVLESLLAGLPGQDYPSANGSVAVREDDNLRSRGLYIR